MNNLINISFITKRGGHEDMIVRVPKNKFCGIFDSYYLILDDAIKTNLVGLEKIKLVCVHLIEYWLKRIRTAKNDTVFYLPIDFSDQSIGCFRIKKKDDNLTISYGYTLIEAFFVDPSNPRNFSNMVKDFKENAKFSSFVVKQDEFVAALHENIRNLRGVKDIVA